MDENLIESALVWLIVVLVAKVPFAKNTRGVPCRLELLRDRCCIQRHPFSLKNSVRNPVLELVPAGHQRASGGGASRTDMEIRKAPALVSKRVQIWCL